MYKTIFNWGLAFGINFRGEKKKKQKENNELKFGKMPLTTNDDEKIREKWKRELKQK